MKKVPMIIDVSDDVNDHQYYLRSKGMNTITEFSFLAISKKAAEIRYALDKLGITCTIFYSEKASHHIYMETSNAALLGAGEGDD